jgi:hypothetical protein
LNESEFTKLDSLMAAIGGNLLAIATIAAPFIVLLL